MYHMLRALLRLCLGFSQIYGDSKLNKYVGRVDIPDI